MTNCHTETRVLQETATQVLAWAFPRNIAWTATAVYRTKASNAVANGVNVVLPPASAALATHSVERTSARVETAPWLFLIDQKRPQRYQLLFQHQRQAPSVRTAVAG
jgi:uncharacterized MAPEG superfamily protein